MELMMESAYRRGEWLHVPVSPDGDAGEPRAGSHAHETRLQLLALGLWPAKWINSLFSTGGIGWTPDGELRLRAFPAAAAADPLQRRAAAVLAASGGAYAQDWPEVLHEDDWCLVLNKPAGMPVHGSGEAPRPAGSRASHAAATGKAPACPATLDEAAACRCLAAGDPLPARHIHRIDDDTSGPVLYAKNDLAQQVLDAAMREKAIGRQYWAAVHGAPNPPEGKIDQPIGKDRHHPSRRRVSPGGDRAVTFYKVLESWRSAALVQLALDTGRTHQIRVHMSHIGHPLLGDGLYGGASPLLGRQALHGRLLRFRHPWTGSDMVIEAPLPADMERLLARLRAGKP
ncbi:RluA family pseudouridine synthase [Paenibacillus sp. D51F]